MAVKSDGASAERIKELADMFKSFDKDGDGRITFIELKEALENIGDYKSEKDIRDMITEVDQDKNGTIEFSEFAMYFDKNIKEMQAKRDEMELTFNTFDIDGDGYITFKELKTVFSSMGEEMSEQNVKDMIKKVDLNHDGKLDFNEFAKLWKKLNTEDD